MMRILLFLLALILLSAPQAARASIAIDETNFPDENFRQYLLSQYYGEYPESVAPVASQKPDTPWYDLNGRRLNGKPNRKGIYIQGGQIKMIK